MQSRATLWLLVFMGVAMAAAQGMAQDVPFDIRRLFGRPAVEDDPFAEPEAEVEEEPVPEDEPTDDTPADELPSIDPTRPIAPPPSGFEVELLDGTLLRGELDLTEIAVATKYGDLKVPITELVSIAPGLDTRVEQKSRLGALIDRLGADAYADRQQAQNDLNALGPAVAEIVRAATKSDNVERANRAKAILDGFAAQERTWGPSSALPLAELDEVTTRQFSASGRVQLKSITVEGVYGTVTVDLQHVKRVRRASEIQPTEVFAATKVAGDCVAGSKTHNSQIMVRRGDTVSLRASGTIRSDDSGWSFRPDGSQDYGYFNESQRIATGALIVQIGESGDVKLAGSKSSFVADADGPLTFSIAASPQFSRYTMDGNYEVKVRVVSPK